MEEQVIIDMYKDYMVLDKSIKDIASERDLDSGDLAQIFRDNNLFLKRDFACEEPLFYINKKVKFTLGYNINPRDNDIMIDLVEVLSKEDLSLNAISILCVDIVKHYNREWLKADYVKWRESKKIYDIHWN